MTSTLHLSNAQIAREKQGGVALPPSPEKIQAKFELSIALTLSTWPALTIAVQNYWGGPLSSEKRDWFAGAISDHFTNAPEACKDVDYVEEFLFNVMTDEFETRLEDGSPEEVAAKLVGLRKLTLQGDFGLVDEMYRRWTDRQRKGPMAVDMKFVERGEDDDETDWDSDDLDEEEDEDEDTEMGEAPELVKVQREKVMPEVDEDGFTKVVGKKKRQLA